MMPDNNNGSPAFSRAHSAQTHTKISKTKAKWLQRMTWEVNKFPYSFSRKLGLYSFDRIELEWYYKVIRELADKVLDILECPYCEDTIKKAVLPGCGCTNPLACCSKCWLEAGSLCLNCKKQCTSVPFESIDDIVQECHLFYKEKAFNREMKCGDREVRGIAESYYRFLKQSEMELMCNYCFGHLENTMTVNSRNETRKALCEGCHEMHMECYGSTEPSVFPTFDRLTTEFTQVFQRLVTFCEQNKTQAYSDPLPPVQRPSYLKKLGLRRVGVKAKFFGIYGIVKKAVFVAACAYLVVYFVK